MTEPLRVASVPSGHVYVRHLAPLPARQVDAAAALPEVVRLPDPDPADPARAAGAIWWPPAMLEADWVADADPFDLMHVQFGFDARTPGQLADLVAALRRRRIPLVSTVHDLRNPHHLDRAAHDAQLDVLIPAADALITLTDGAADEVERRWGRRPMVLPHPHVVELPTMAAFQRDPEQPGGGVFRIGLHLKSLRASVNAVPVLRALVDIVRRLPGGVLQVDGHAEALTPGGTRFDPALHVLVTEAVEAGAIDLCVHDYFTDDDLWAYLRSLDVSVLPYRFGTHSGWLEACRDLGTIVVAPDCGYYRDQGPVVEYTNNEAGFDPESLERAIVHAFQRRPYAPASIADRIAQRARVADAHARLYASLVG